MSCELIDAKWRKIYFSDTHSVQTVYHQLIIIINWYAQNVFGGANVVKQKKAKIFVHPIEEKNKNILNLVEAKSKEQFK